MAKRRRFRHILNRHGLGAEIIRTPPLNEFGPLVSLGLIQLGWWGETRRVRRFVRRASRADLATFIGLCAAIGETELMVVPRAGEVTLATTGSTTGSALVMSTVRVVYP